MVVPKNVGGSATACDEWSFTTDAPPYPMTPIVPITPSPIQNLNFDGTTDSGSTFSCMLDWIRSAWTATTAGLLWRRCSGNPGIIPR